MRCEFTRGSDSERLKTIQSRIAWFKRNNGGDSAAICQYWPVGYLCRAVLSSAFCERLRKRCACDTDLNRVLVNRLSRSVYRSHASIKRPIIVPTSITILTLRNNSPPNYAAVTQLQAFSGWSFNLNFNFFWISSYSQSLPDGSTTHSSYHETVFHRENFAALHTWNVLLDHLRWKTCSFHKLLYSITTLSKNESGSSHIATYAEPDGQFWLSMKMLK